MLCFIPVYPERVGWRRPPLSRPKAGLTGKFMSQEKTEAIVLRGVDFSESSRILTFLCPERGRMAGIVKGVRRKGSRTAALFDTLNRIELIYYWKDSRQVQQVAEATLLDDYRAIKQDLEKSVYATFPLELAYKIAHENEPSASLYAQLQTGLESLRAWHGSCRTHSAWQALGLLSVAGFALTPDHCGGCGARLGERTGFSWESGLVCRDCRADRRLRPEQDEALRRLCTAQALCPAVEVSGALFDMIGQYAAHQVESRFRSLRVLQQIFG